MPETFQSLRHAPPSCRTCSDFTNIERSHAVGAGWVGVGVTCRPGSSTPGGNGFDRDATNAPTPAHAAKTATQIAIFRGFGTARGYRERPQPMPRPVINARSDRPKQMNDAAVNSTHGSVHRPPVVRPSATSRDITCAIPRSTSGPNPYT